MIRSSQSILRKRGVFLQQQRKIWPIVAGVVIFSALTVVQYGMRAYQRMEKETKDGGEDAQTDGSNSSSNNSSTEGKHMKDFKKSIGIDFGSSFNKIGYREDSKIDVIEDKTGRRSIASAISLPVSEPPMCGQLARNTRFSKPTSTYFGTSLMMGLKRDEDILNRIQSQLPYKVDSTSISIADMNIKIAKDLATVALEKKIARSPAAISYPNFFKLHQQDALKSTMREAGLDAVALLPDAVAAVLGSIQMGELKIDKSAAASTIAVIDLGGRITQFSLVHADLSPSSSQPLSLVDHVTLFDVGGDFFDDAIVKFLSDKFTLENKGIHLLTDPQAKQRLYDAAEAAKIELSNANFTVVSIPFITADQTGLFVCLLNLVDCIII